MTTDTNSTRHFPFLFLFSLVLILVMVVLAALRLGTKEKLHSNRATVLSLGPTAAVPRGSRVELPIEIDTQGQRVSAVDLVIRFPPEALDTIEIVPGPLWKSPTVLAWAIDEANGRARFALGTLTPAPGAGTLALMSARVKPTARKSTAVFFGKETQAAAIGEPGNVISETLGTTIVVTP